MLLRISGKKEYSLLFCMCMIVLSPLHGFQRYNAIALNLSSYQGTIFSVFIFLSFFFCIKFVRRDAITEYLFNTEYNISLYLKTCSSFTWSIKVLINFSWSLAFMWLGEWKVREEMVCHKGKDNRVFLWQKPFNIWYHRDYSLSLPICQWPWRMFVKSSEIH